MKKITPRIVIESKVISCCAACPFFEDSVNGWEEHKFYCNHKENPFSHWGDMDEEIEPSEEIWKKCPLPDEEIDKIDVS